MYTSFLEITYIACQLYDPEMSSLRTKEPSFKNANKGDSSPISQVLRRAAPSLVGALLQAAKLPPLMKIS